MLESKQTALTLRRTCSEVSRIAHRLEAMQVEGPLGRICAKSALCRLDATFRAANELIRGEYVFETDAIVRMLLEQQAWAWQAYSASDEQLKSLNPTKCITPFKAVFSEAGRFYGALSETAHLDPAIITHYMRFHEERTPVVKNSAGDAQYAGYYVTALASVYLEVAQRLFSAFSEHEYSVVDARLRSQHREYCQLLNRAED